MSQVLCKWWWGEGGKLLARAVDDSMFYAVVALEICTGGWAGSEYIMNGSFFHSLYIVVVPSSLCGEQDKSSLGKSPL